MFACAAGVGVAQPVSPGLHINEVESNGGTPGDWFELFNSGASTVDVSGWKMKDNDDTHAFYVFPAGTSIPAGGYLVVEEAQFVFGLGAADSVRIFDSTGALYESYSWTRTPPSLTAAARMERARSPTQSLRPRALQTIVGARCCTSTKWSRMEELPVTGLS